MLVRDIRVQQNSHVTFTDGFDRDDALHDEIMCSAQTNVILGDVADCAKSRWIVPDESLHLKDHIHAALNSSLLELDVSHQTSGRPALVMRGAIRIMPED